MDIGMTYRASRTCLYGIRKSSSENSRSRSPISTAAVANRALRHIVSEPLILAEIGDDHAERIHFDEVVGHLVEQGENEVRCVLLPLQFPPVTGAPEYLLKVDRSFEGRLTEIFHRDLRDMYFDILFIAGQK